MGSTVRLIKGASYVFPDESNPLEVPEHFFNIIKATDFKSRKDNLPDTYDWNTRYFSLKDTAVTNSPLKPPKVSVVSKRFLFY